MINFKNDVLSSIASPSFGFFRRVHQRYSGASCGAIMRSPVLLNRWRGGVYHQVNTLISLLSKGNHGVNRHVSFEANPEVGCVGCQTSSGG